MLMLKLYQGGTIQGSINLPAQSLYPTIPQLFNLFSAAGVKTIVLYCGKLLCSLCFMVFPLLACEVRREGEGVVLCCVVQ